MLGNNDSKIICLTIDVEPDFGGLLDTNYYYGLANLQRLKDLINRYDLRLTAFVTGKTLEDNPDIIEILRAMNAHIEQHSYSHQIGHESKNDDIQRGIETHKKILGVLPKGYRAPQGIITKPEALFLEKMGLKYDSSIFPAFFPGRFNRLNFPTEPFIIKGTNLLELPFAVIPKIRIPIGLSYMQLLGINTFKYLFRIFGIPSFLVFDFHTYDLGKAFSYDKLPLFYKLIYYRSQKINQDPFVVFENFVEYILSKGYKSKYVYEVYEDLKGKSPTWEWKQMS